MSHITSNCWAKRTQVLTTVDAIEGTSPSCLTLLIQIVLLLSQHPLAFRPSLDFCFFSTVRNHVLTSLKSGTGHFSGVPWEVLSSLSAVLGMISWILVASTSACDTLIHVCPRVFYTPLSVLTMRSHGSWNLPTWSPYPRSTPASHQNFMSI